MNKRDRGKKKVPVSGSGSITSFFKRNESSISNEHEPLSTNVHSLPSIEDTIIHDSHPSTHQRVEFDIGCLERDPALRTPIWKYDVNVWDEVGYIHYLTAPINLEV